jgi:hypothetical protein
MLNATFKNLTLAQVREVIPEGVMLPFYNRYEVEVKVDLNSKNGGGYITVKSGGHYVHPVSTDEAIGAIFTFHAASL